uniref:Uncharacterized protein n=1 Tax=Anguilla anguilla TaxID=7936 RepID=A0A0E9QJ00_ANGAN
MQENFICAEVADDTQDSTHFWCAHAALDFP